MSNEQSHRVSVIDVNTTPSDSAATEYFSKVVIRNASVGKSAFDEDGIFGEVENLRDRTLKEVEITIYCQDRGGKTIFERTAYPVRESSFASSEPLKPNYSRQFGVKLDDAPSEWAKKAEVKVTSVKFQ